MSIVLTNSWARKSFKKRFGQANHFLITTLIGLDLVKNNDVTCPASFSTTWKPKDKTASAERSRQFVIQAFLASAIDALDSYLCLINHKPKILPEILRADFEDSNKSRQVNTKFIALYNYYNKPDRSLEYNCYAALIALAIQWRNNLIHYNAKNTVEPQFRAALSKNYDFFVEKCCGLSISDLLCNFDKCYIPTFKEITSITQAIHSFVMIVDQLMLGDTDINQYIGDLVEEFSLESKKSFSTLKQEDRKKKLSNFLLLHGIEFNYSSAEIETLYSKYFVPIHGHS